MGYESASKPVDEELTDREVLDALRKLLRWSRREASCEEVRKLASIASPTHPLERPAILPPPGDDYEKDSWDLLHEARNMNKLPPEDKDVWDLLREARLENELLRKAVRWLWVHSPSDDPPPTWVQEACAAALHESSEE